MASTPSPSRGCAVSPRLGTALAPRLFSPPRRLAPRTRIVAAAHHARGSSRPAAPPRVVDASDRRASSATAPSRGTPPSRSFAWRPRPRSRSPRRTPRGLLVLVGRPPDHRRELQPRHVHPQVFWFAMILAQNRSAARHGLVAPVLVAPGSTSTWTTSGSTSPARWRRRRSSGGVRPDDRRGTGPTAPSPAARRLRSMLENPNFVTEVGASSRGTFVGRWMWLDAVERDVPLLWACLLTTNFTGPPGLLQYFLVCLLSGKGLPPADADAKNAARKSAALAPPPMIPAASPDAGALVARLWDAEGGGTNYSSGALALGWSASDVAAACAEDVRWEDLSHSSDALVGRAAVFEHLAARETRDAAGGAGWWSSVGATAAAPPGSRGTGRTRPGRSGCAGRRSSRWTSRGGPRTRATAEPQSNPAASPRRPARRSRPPAESPVPLPDAARRRPRPRATW